MKPGLTLQLSFSFTQQPLPSGRQNFLAVLAPSLEFHNTVRRCEQGIIAASADIDARMNVRASLSVKDIAGQNKLTVCPLCAKALDSESRPFLVDPTPFL